MKKINKKHIDSFFDLEKISLSFAKTNRVTLHEDGVRPESDTDHTFMLGLVAGSLADSFYKRELDIGLVLQFALLHDLVEVYAGDTDRIKFHTEADEKLKIKKEKESFKKLQKNFGETFPWIHKTIKKYELQDTKEARFVKLVDKILTEPTNIFNNFAYFNENNISRERFYEFFNKKLEKCQLKFGKEFSEILDLYSNTMNLMFKHYEKKQKK